ncbi:hypothetical protein ACFQ4C_09750 [Larkinella insperata]|uniref:Uncharacterized protein n=1 Tax=Larkinella insperata TaxID=332158 RepID=A0ABW3Q6H6_9BACT|nr:hypothetical protein [Larkinella insperata]
MKTHWLFPHRYRLIGWLLFVPSAILGVVNRYAEFSPEWLGFSWKAPTPDAGFVSKFVWGLAGGGNFLTNSYNAINFTDELAALGVIVGLLFVAFSKEKVEDEMISRLRLESLQWAVYVNYIVLGALIVLVHGGLFLEVMIYNMFTVLLMFIIRFRLAIRRNERTVLMAL